MYKLLTSYFFEVLALLIFIVSLSLFFIEKKASEELIGRLEEVYLKRDIVYEGCAPVYPRIIGSELIVIALKPREYNILIEGRLYKSEEDVEISTIKRDKEYNESVIWDEAGRIYSVAYN